MLGLQGIKGTLDAGADADLIILSEVGKGGIAQVRIDDVWKFGTCVWTSAQS
jgi:N-acetylglucosamine-6-phosphate deacetylase